MKAWRSIAVLAAAVLVLAAGCGGDGDGGKSQEIVRLTAATPFPSGITFYPLYVAQERGYFEQEGISVRTEPVDGSGATLQQLLSGQADIAIPSPGPFLQAVAKGGEIASVYTMYQSNVFSLQTLADSDIASIEDLRGKTIGVGSLEGGETPFVKALLDRAAGLKEGDYKLLEVGDGGTAAVALDKGDVSAYTAAFVDVAIMRLRGIELRNLIPDDFPQLFDTLVVVKRKLIDEQPEVIEGLGRALAKATVWSLEHPEETIDITSKSFPEENEDRKFSLALLKETQALFALPDAADGKWGVAVEENVDDYIDFLVQTGELEEEADPDVFVNDHVDAYNDFDEDDL